MDGLGEPEVLAERRDDLTPMLRQYADVCAAYDDALVLFQVGDFYETFCDAAETLARTVGITLTQRTDSTGEYPMAGVPVEKVETYVERLLDAGYRVAVAEQVEPAGEGSGVVDRQVTRVVTPGTLTEDELLDADDNNFLACVARTPSGASDPPRGSNDATGDSSDATGGYGLAALDVSTGECYATGTDSPATVRDELARVAPAEVVVGPDVPADDLDLDCPATEFRPGAFGAESARERVGDYFGSPERLLSGEAEIRACGGLLAYAEYARGGDDGRLAHLTHLTRFDAGEYLRLDATALASLEVFEPRGVHGEAGATLVGVVDETVTAMGSRRLKRWLARPLLDRERIAARLDSVEELRDGVRTRDELREHLRTVYDLERLIARISRGQANARDLRALESTLSVVPDLADLLADTGADSLREIHAGIDDLSEVREHIDRALVADPPAEITDGGLVASGYDEDLDHLRAKKRDAADWIDDLQARERERTGISSLKVGHNTVHGYYVEVTKPNLDAVPETYERRQTLKNAERFTTPELRDRESEIVEAETKADDREHRLFVDLREAVAGETGRVQSVASHLADLDALAALAEVAAQNDYARPSLGGDAIRIRAGRHPVVERTGGSFVPNDVTLDEEGFLAVVTGPNMAGKSTYLRQVALIQLLAQVGSFVPAAAASLPLVDRIFTRVGASDDIAGGRSTFMVEMTELAAILRAATDRSLVILDEVGRGTSTADGLAIARAVTEHLHDEVGAYTLFATHHHDLTDVAGDLPGVRNWHFPAERDGDRVRFTHEVAPGPATASYGVDVARVAGLPSDVVDRSRALVADDTNARDASAATSRGARVEMDGGMADLAAELRRLDLATTTPIEALNELHRMQGLVGRNDEWDR
jgi:DNA mismatch repair protein MutS